MGIPVKFENPPADRVPLMGMEDISTKVINYAPECKRGSSIIKTKEKKTEKENKIKTSQW